MWQEIPFSGISHRRESYRYRWPIIAHIQRHVRRRTLQQTLPARRGVYVNNEWERVPLSAAHSVALSTSRASSSLSRPPRAPRVALSARPLEYLNTTPASELQTLFFLHDEATAGGLSERRISQWKYVRKRQFGDIFNDKKKDAFTYRGFRSRIFNYNISRLMWLKNLLSSYFFYFDRISYY